MQLKINKLLYYTSIFLVVTSFLVMMSFLNTTKVAVAQNSESQNSEVKLLPNWNSLSLNSLGTFVENGRVGTEYNDLVGYDVSRIWTTENTPDRVLKLGDLEKSLAAQDFTLAQIINLNNPNKTAEAIDILGSNGVYTDKAYVDESISEIPISDFPLVGQQTLETLVEAVPDLGLETAADVLPIADLLTQAGFSNLNLDLATLIENEEIANLELDSVNLSEYTVDSIPGVENAKLGNFEGYQESYVSEVPGLSDVPLSEYPEALEGIGNFSGRVDFVWGSAESNRNRTISGSYIEGFNVPCQSNCEYVELDDLENAGTIGQSNFEGKQWISGREHWVAGGTGCFSGGREPTGIHNFGDSFKTVLWTTDETSDTATVMMFFNIKSNCGESAYFIGPVPFPQGIIRVNDWIYLGTGV